MNNSKKNLRFNSTWTVARLNHQPERWNPDQRVKCSHTCRCVYLSSHRAGLQTGPAPQPAASWGSPLGLPQTRWSSAPGTAEATEGRRGTGRPPGGRTGRSSESGWSPSDCDPGGVKTTPPGAGRSEKSEPRADPAHARCSSPSAPPAP